MIVLIMVACARMPLDVARDVVIALQAQVMGLLGLRMPGWLAGG